MDCKNCNIPKDERDCNFCKDLNRLEEANSKKNKGVGSMDKSFILSLKQACKNRNLELIDNNDGTASVNGIKFNTIREIEDYIESFKRTDI